MRSFLFIALVACTGLFNACKKSANYNYKTDTSLNIALHNCANNIFADNQVRLCFDAVISDSRCPANAMCVWQGTAVCRFLFYKNDHEYPLVLSTLSLPGLYNKDTIAAGYKIEFINLMPYPGLPPDSDHGNEIKAEVKITKL